MLSGVPFGLSVAMFFLLMLVPTTFSQEAKLDRLLQRSPMPANSICYLHTPSLKKLLADANLDLAIADKVEEVWLISDLDTEELRPNWEAGYATMKQNMDIESAAKALGGYVDAIGNQKVVWTPKQGYVLPVGPDRIGFLRPAKRDLLVDWIDGATTNPIPTFLSAQAKQPEQYLSFMLSVNLKNRFSPVGMAKQAASFNALKNMDPQAIGKLLSTVQGVSLIVGRKSLSDCIFTVEFSQSPASLASIGNALFSEILNRHGAGAPEVASWKTKVDGNKLSLQGQISAESLDGVLGIFSIRGFAEEVSENLTTGSSSKEIPANATQIASKQYFDKVLALIDRVRKYDAQSSGYRAKWDEQQARRIDELGTLNVDPQLIEYGSNVSSILRGNAIAIRTGNVAAGQLQASQAGASYGYYGDYYGGYYGPENARRDQAVTGAQQRMGAFGSYREAIAQIDQMTGEIRRAMTEKFQVQF